jgi:multidrug efflux pump
VDFTRAAVTRVRTTIIFVLVLLFAGFSAYRTLPRAEDPGFIIRAALVQTRFPGASPERVEQLVTDKIERKIQELPQVDYVSSSSRTGFSSVTVNIKAEYKDMRPIWDELRRKVEDVEGELPDGAKKPHVWDDFGDVYGILVSVTGQGYEYDELEDVVQDVRDEMLRLPDAKKVDIWGGQEERVFLEYKNERLAELGLSANQLAGLLASQNIVSTGGSVLTDSERYVLEPTGNFESVEQIGELLVQVPGRRDVVPLRDIVTIKRGYVDPPSIEVRSTGTPAMILAMSMREGGNIMRLGDDTKALMTRLTDIHPIGVDFDIVVFQPDDVARSVDDFTSSLLQAVAVVMFAMILFLGIRTGIVVASLIPSAIAASLFIMSMLDIGLDKMSLAALIIALGMLVDNAIVMAESIMVQMEAGKDRVEAAVQSAKELRVPLLTSSLTTCAAFLPIYLAESGVGEYTAPLFKVVTIALLSSWALALTLTPALCVLFVKVKKTVEGATYQGKFYEKYRAFLILALRKPLVSLGIVGVVFVGAMSAFALVPAIFMPPADNPTFTIELELPTGTAIEKTRKTTIRLERFMQNELLVGPGRENGAIKWATYIGSGGPRFYLSHNAEQTNPRFAAFVVQATDREDAVAAMPKVRKFIADEMPDVRATVDLRKLGPSSKAPVMFQVSGADSDQLFALVDRLKEQLKKTEGTTSVRDDWGQRAKKLVVRVNQPRARRAGVTSQDVALSLRTAFDGFTTTEYREGDESIPVVLRSLAADRNDIGKLETLAVYSQSTRGTVPLKQVADVELVWEPSVVLRKDRNRAVTVLTDLQPGFNAALVNNKTIAWLEKDQQTWPAGYRWEAFGEAKSSEEGNQSINEKLPIALFLIVLLLVMQFDSMRKPLIILATIPLALIGVVIGLLVMRSYFGFMTLLGVVSLAGIVINNAIVLLDRIKLEIEENGHPPSRAIVEAAQRRLRPILLTTFTTMLGLIPLYLGGGPMFKPMAVAVIFGLGFATTLTLGVVPILYAILYRVRFKDFVYQGK